MKRSILYAVMALLLLCGCSEAEEVRRDHDDPQGASEAQAASIPEASEPESLHKAPSSAAEERSEASPKEEPTPQVVPGLPEGYDGDNPDHVLQYFIYLLETGDTYDVPESQEGFNFLSVKYVNITYQDSIFHGTPIQVDGFAKMEQEGDYLLELQIPEDCAQPLRPGGQQWSFRVSRPSYGDFIGPRNMMEIGKHQAMNAILEASGKEVLDKIIHTISLTEEEFASPKDIVGTSRMLYILYNLETGKATQRGQGDNLWPYVSAEDMQRWYETYFGVPFDTIEGEDTIFYGEYGPDGTKAYSYAIGWDPYRHPYTFIYTYSDDDGDHYIYEMCEQYIGYESIAKQVMRYTIKDGIVWSCEDVSDRYPPSPYYDADALKALESQ